MPVKTSNHIPFLNAPKLLAEGMVSSEKDITNKGSKNDGRKVADSISSISDPQAKDEATGSGTGLFRAVTR
ncbi:hypothetical protein T265_11548 [Opisthorchis viverrini]|uniref:Uncharacterized protein n=1 Tax=Opisthorchis viverrini TaxID=6198 RepID=A0A074YYN6_OPIVI|nr:hypothetical protein T265_11548 [Opisthorchis viverrini]KER19768.1 hypothetical protein T265_11548 [Opisthorchis viverrini]